MTDTTKTEAQHLAHSLASTCSPTAHLAAAELRRLDKIEGIADELQDQLHRQAIRLSAVEAERDRFSQESARHFIRAREWAERAGAMEAERDRLAAECEALRGLVPDLPPRPQHYNDASYQHPALPRYGLRWNGPGQPVSVPMADGYWTPFHLALAAMGGKESQAENCSGHPQATNKEPSNG